MYLFQTCVLTRTKISVGSNLLYTKRLGVEKRFSWSWVRNQLKQTYWSHCGSGQQSLSGATSPSVIFVVRYCSVQLVQNLCLQFLIPISKNCSKARNANLSIHWLLSLFEINTNLDCRKIGVECSGLDGFEFFSFLEFCYHFIHCFAKVIIIGFKHVV